jgi:hypothetical protein
LRETRGIARLREQLDADPRAIGANTSRTNCASARNVSPIVRAAGSSAGSHSAMHCEPSSAMWSRATR